jgi:ribulose 1,5-bisphosphate synthetase/thiazole synthase
MNGGGTPTGQSPFTFNTVTMNKKMDKMLNNLKQKIKYREDTGMLVKTCTNARESPGIMDDCDFNQSVLNTPNP